MFLSFSLCPGPPEQFENWLSTFRLEEMKGEISELLVNSPSIRSLYTKMVSIFLYSFVPVSSLKTHLHFFSHLGSCGCCSFRILAEVFLQSLPVRPGSNISLIYQNVLASSRCRWLHLVANWRKNKNKHVKSTFTNVGSTEIIQNVFMFNFQQ